MTTHQADAAFVAGIRAAQAQGLAPEDLADWEIELLARHHADAMPVSQEETLAEALKLLRRATDLVAYAITGPTVAPSAPRQSPSDSPSVDSGASTVGEVGADSPPVESAPAIDCLFVCSRCLGTCTRGEHPGSAHGHKHLNSTAEFVWFDEPATVPPAATQLCDRPSPFPAIGPCTEPAGHVALYGTWHAHLDRSKAMETRWAYSYAEKTQTVKTTIPEPQALCWRTARHGPHEWRTGEGLSHSCPGVPS